MKKLLVVLLIIGLGYVFLNSAYFSIQKVEYLENEILSADFFSDIHGKNIILFDDVELKERLESKSMIESVKIQKKYPSTLQLDIQYRKPYLMIKDNNINIYISEDIYVIGIDNSLQADYSVEGVEIYSYELDKKIEMYDNMLLEQVIKLIKLIKKSPVEVDDKIIYNDDSIILQTKEGLHVKFGDCESIEKRFNNFINIYMSLEEEKKNANGVIDVSISDLPLYRNLNKGGSFEEE